MPTQLQTFSRNYEIFEPIFRIQLAGSSQCGKTTFATNMLKDLSLFTVPPTNIIYFHSLDLEIPAVDWHEILKIPVSYKTGLPTIVDLKNLEEYTCIVIDDLADRANNSIDVCNLFKVLSGKLKLSVIMMTQNIFSKGAYSRDIRNSSNYTVLFRNCCDASINIRIARQLCLVDAFKAAEEDTYFSQDYPYILFDQTPRGQRSIYRVFTDIFSRYKISYSNKGLIQ